MVRTRSGQRFGIGGVRTGRPCAGELAGSGPMPVDPVERRTGSGEPESAGGEESVPSAGRWTLLERSMPPRGGWISTSMTKSSTTRAMSTAFGDLSGRHGHSRHHWRLYRPGDPAVPPSPAKITKLSVVSSRPPRAMLEVEAPRLGAVRIYAMARQPAEPGRLMSVTRLKRSGSELPATERRAPVPACSSRSRSRKASRGWPW